MAEQVLSYLEARKERILKKVFSVDELGPALSLHNRQQPSPLETAEGVQGFYSSRILLLKGSITKLQVDGIVNAANEGLLGGGGIDEAVHKRQLDLCYTLNVHLRSLRRALCFVGHHALPMAINY